MNPIIQSGVSIVPRARHKDVHTSHESARSALKGAGRHASTILTCIVFDGPQTASQISGWTGIDSVEITRRLSDLHRLGKVKRIQTGTFDGKPIYKTRLTPSGRPACVWMLA
jgi:predicted ArsR family transcriptional regulator